MVSPALPQSSSPPSALPDSTSGTHDVSRPVEMRMVGAPIAISSPSTATTATLPPYPGGSEESTARDDVPVPSSASASVSASTLAGDEEEEEGEKASDKWRLAAEEFAMAERLRRKGSAAALPAAEAKRRVLELKREALKAGAEPRRNTEGLFKSVCSTDLLFLIDTTGSMASHINAAKEQIKSIVNEITEVFLNEAEVRIAVVGYKDHCDSPNVQFIDFTTSADEVRSFLGRLAATGGGDAPEDVLGGIQQALNLTWKQQTRCIIHIADAPAHGRNSHDFPDSCDRYARPGSEPHSLLYQPLLTQMIQLNINYAMLRINHTTDRMAYNFFQEYLAAAASASDCRLLNTNKHWHEASTKIANMGSSSRGSGKRRGKALLFEEAELGTSFSELRHLVVRNVVSSASRTAVRSTSSSSSSSSNPRTTSKRAFFKKAGPNLAAVEEDEDDADDSRLETVPPQWDTPGWLNQTLRVEGFSPDIAVHGAHTLDDMMAHDDNITMCITELILHKRSRPFAQGAMRIASYARQAASTNRFVVKSFKRGGKKLAHLAEDMRCQAMCKAFALEFNALSEENSIDFIVTTCLKAKSEKAVDSAVLSLEPFIEGKYVKYNNNCGYVNESSEDKFNQAAQAFSHFTFERSQGRFLVSDLQGVGRLLTDPAIHTLDPDRFRLADTNLGQEGFKFFFATHVCNDICRKLELKSNASMLKTGGTLEFRESWPKMDNTVCCSNKLCGRIVALSKANKSEKFPDYYWCDECWPQLVSSVETRVCVGPGPHHDFETSKFFCESQGRITPDRCPEHYEEEEKKAISNFFYTPPERESQHEHFDFHREDVVPKSSFFCGGFWSRMKSAAKKKNVQKNS